MNDIKQINIALLGCGKLGTGIFLMWKKNRRKFLELTGVDIYIRHILVKNIHYKRDRAILKDLITDKVDHILEDKSVQVVIDAMGGIEPTYGIVKLFLENGIHLVSANRALLASKMKTIFELARKKEVHLRFEAAIGGGIPLIRTMRRDLIAARITSMWGIVSGSSNYLLSEMTRTRKTLQELIESPEVVQLAESHMLIDFEGSDAAQKIALVAATVFGVDVNFLHIYSEGLSRLTPFDIECADRYGYIIKHLAIVRDLKDGIELRVHPTLVPKKHPLNSVENDYIAYFVRTQEIGQFLVSGKGAGIHPAASIIFRDLVDLATSIKISTKYMYEFPMWNNKKVIPMKNISSGYYLRFPCVDVPGVIGKITSVIGKQNININSAHASVETANGKSEMGYVHIFCNRAREKDILGAIEKIKAMDTLRGEIKLFRILNENDL